MTVDALSLGDLGVVAGDASDVLGQVHHLMAKPDPTKQPPVYSSSIVAELCGIERTKMPYLAKKHDLPLGTKVEGSKAREFSLEETVAWSTTFGNRPVRPEGALGAVVAVCNYKGGVGKSSTAVMTAQALTLRGQKVLLVDCDGQGTATQLCGLNPEQNVEEEQTIMPFIGGEAPDLRYAVQPTYWYNLSIIPAFSGILAAEFVLPSRAMQSRGFEFYNQLKIGLEPLRKDFDIIIIDTSPSLSYLTINAMLAATGLLMPCPPNALDFASSVQFWGLFDQITQKLPIDKDEKRFSFLTVLFNKVESNDAHRVVKGWMASAYGKHINGIEIPDSVAAQTSTAQLKTIYDLSKPDGTVESYRRYKEPLDRLADFVLEKVSLDWRK